MRTTFWNREQLPVKVWAPKTTFFEAMPERRWPLRDGGEMVIPASPAESRVRPPTTRYPGGDLETKRVTRHLDKPTFFWTWCGVTYLVRVTMVRIPILWTPEEWVSFTPENRAYYRKHKSYLRTEQMDVYGDAMNLVMTRRRIMRLSRR